MILQGFRYGDKVPRESRTIWVKRGKGKAVLAFHEYGDAYVETGKGFSLRPNHIWAYPVAPDTIEIPE